VGIGDDIIATGMARGALKRGERIAFGDGKKIRWGPYSEMVFRNNPNIARPGEEHRSDVRWINYYKGNRIYNRSGGTQWLWNYEFKIRAGEFYFDASERQNQHNDLIIVEPNVPQKPCGPNKQWPLERWKAVADELTAEGFTVRQFDYGAPHRVAEGIPSPSFRQAAAWLQNARLAILPEGGLHHAAAAVGAPAIVLFGGFVPPKVLGYAEHVNLTGNTKTACGSFRRCPHCVSAMESITVDDVLDAAEKILCH